MKKYLFLFIFSCLFSFLNGQNAVSVTVLVTPPYSPYLSDYTGNGGQLLIQLTNNTSNILQIKLTGSITGNDNGLFLFTKPDYQPGTPIVLAPFQSVQVAASGSSTAFLDGQNIETNLSQAQQNTIFASGVLPEGLYTVCVRAEDFLTGEFYSPENPSGCTTFQISYPVPPILINPLCSSDLINPFPVFSWTPLFSPGSFFLYDLYILELAESQIPDDAMWLAISANVGNPIVIPNNVSASYTYRPSDIPLKAGKTYAWCVRVRDAANQIIVLNEGRSEVCTFIFNPVVPDVLQTPVIVENTDAQGGTLLPEFDLNNTSVTGKLLYRFYNNENQMAPANPAYNPTIQTQGETLSFVEINQTPASNSSNNQNASNVNTGRNPRPGSASFFGLQATPDAVYANSGTLRIDPGVKYLYQNTYSNVGSEPIRNTSISAYLEYVAVKKVFSDGETYFEVVPAADMYYNKVAVNQHGVHIDPQLEHAAVAAGLSPKSAASLRPTSSELIGTAFTDSEGNFTFMFDLAENTGLLNQGPVQLLGAKFPPPEVPAESQQWVNPLDLVSNPADQVFSPGDVLSDPGQGLIGNGMLQGNSGWGLQNNFLQNSGNNLFNNINNINNNLNQNMPGGPAAPEIYLANDDLIEYIPYKAHYLFKVIRIKINDDRFISPDIFIFAQPGESINLPPVSTVVNSYDAEIKLIAGGTNGDECLLEPGSPVSGYTVKAARMNSFWQAKPSNFPIQEGMDIQPEQLFHINGNTPYYIGWNQSYTKPSLLRLSAEQISSQQGKVLFTNLVKNVWQVDNDRHYFEVQMPLTQYMNYGGSWGSFSASAKQPELSANRISAYNFRPARHEVEVKLEPLPPEVLLRTVAKSNIQTAPLADVNVYLLEYDRNASGQYAYKGFKKGKTDENGYERFQNVSMSVVPSAGVVNPYRRVMLNKAGYKIKYLPADKPQPMNDTDYIQPLKRGQRYDFQEIMMSGSANVFGYVRNEENEPVSALIQIGDGPFQMTEMSPFKSGYNNPLIKSVQEEVPQLSSLLASAAFNIINSSGTNANTFQLNNNGFSGAGNIIPNQHMQDAFEMVSRFSMNAPATGSNTRVIVIPMSEQFFPDTFYVNIPASESIINIGTFMVYEKAHRVKINVKKEISSRSGTTQQAAAGAIVQVGDYAGVADNQGNVAFKFKTPDAFFRFSVNHLNFVAIEEYRYLPVSKTYHSINYTMLPGMRITGVVSDAVSNQPIEGARVYAQSGFTMYGPTMVETFTDQNGTYELIGLPRTPLAVYATKNSDEKSYAAGIFQVNNAVGFIQNANISLQPVNNLIVSRIHGFPFELNTIQTLQNGDVRVSGFITDIPENSNFSLFNSSGRVRVNNVVMRAGTQLNQAGLPVAYALNDHIPTLESIVRVKINDVFSGDLKGYYNNSFLQRIHIKSDNNGGGALAGMVLTDLESFRFSFSYQGKFYLGKSSFEPVFPVFFSAPQVPDTPEFYLMDVSANGTPRDISFVIHGFDAKSEKDLSRLKRDTFKIATRLFPHLQLSSDVVVDAGFIFVTPENISISNPGEELSFNLEDWTLKSDQGWSFSIPLGGIIIPSAKINTSLADIPVSNLILRPNELIMPEAGVDLNNLSLGGGVVPLKKYPGITAVLNLDMACSYDLMPHWRFSVYKSGNSSAPACYIQGLPGFAAGQKIDVGAFTVFSNNSTLIQPIQQQPVFENVGNFNIQNIINLPDALEIAGALHLGIPGMTVPTAVFSFIKQQNQIIRQTKSFDVALETTGKVFFNGATGTNNYVFQNGYFEAKGDLYFENEDLYDDKRIALKGLLTKQGNQIVLSIPKLQENETDQAFQYISLEGENDTKLKIIQGNQSVAGGVWNEMVYTADLVGVTGLPADNRLDYVVAGAIEVDRRDDNAVAIENIETPLGGLSVVFNWEEVSFTGSLSLNIPVQMGAVTLNSGMFEIRFDGTGFYFDFMGNVSLPGLDAFADVNVGVLSGYYPELPVTVLNRHKEIMYLLDVPDHLKTDGIAGIYINANMAPGAANWSLSIPVPLFSIGMGVSAGADLNFLINFGASEKSMSIEAAAYARAWAGVQVVVCTMCVGAMAQFIATGKLKFAPQASLELGACASFTMFGDFCGASFSESIGCDIQMDTNTGLTFNVQWEPCSDSATKKDTSCDL